MGLYSMVLCLGVLSFALFLRGCFLFGVFDPLSSLFVAACMRALGARSESFFLLLFFWIPFASILFFFFGGLDLVGARL